MSEKELREQVLELVKNRLEISDDSQNDLILTYVDEVGNRIKHYCNIDGLPNDLKFVWASIAQHIIFYVQGSYTGETADTISSVKIGDTQTSINQPNKLNSPAFSNKVIDDVILNYKADLSPYRKLRW